MEEKEKEKERKGFPVSWWKGADIIFEREREREMN